MTANRGELLVAILNNPKDLAILRAQGWYRIPVSSAAKWLQERWPPQWLAWYQTGAFGNEEHAVHYYGEVVEIRQVQRWQLFPDEPHDARAERRYYQVFVKSVEKLYRRQ